VRQAVEEPDRAQRARETGTARYSKIVKRAPAYEGSGQPREQEQTRRPRIAAPAVVRPRDDSFLERRAACAPAAIGNINGAAPAAPSSGMNEPAKNA
jgi:hypothetical protein